MSQGISVALQYIVVCFTTNFYFIIKLHHLCNLDIALGHIVILIIIRIIVQLLIKHKNNKPCLNCELNSE